jgi:hypothetical protein
MEGTSFFPSAMRAFGLIARNIARVAMVSVVGSVAVVIGNSPSRLLSLAQCFLLRKDLCDGRLRWAGLSLHVQLHAGSASPPPLRPSHTADCC